VTLFDESVGPSRCRLVVAYDGTGFHGFAEQANVRTVGGTLRRTIEKVTRHDAPLTYAGRTDTGVHAWGQVVAFDATPGLDPWRVQSALNGILAPEIVVRSAEIVDPSFDPRRGAEWRTYRYTILNRPVPDPFLARYSWWVPEVLDVKLLRLAADPFLGEHDFAAFCRKGQEGSTTTRRVLESCWEDRGDGVLVYRVRATAFCWQMVRSIVGTLVEVGHARKRPGDIMTILRARDRAAAGQLAPPHGLCLWEVAYPGSTR
jgi:tRNA pseudouridine38-40 synthase